MSARAIGLVARVGKTLEDIVDLIFEIQEGVKNNLMISEVPCFHIYKNVAMLQG